MGTKNDIKNRCILLLIAFSAILYGCTSRVSNNDIYDVSDLMELSEEVDESEQESHASANKWKFDKHYKDNLFFNDYSKEKGELTAAYYKLIDKRFREHQEVTKNYVPEKDFTKPYSFEYFFDLEIEFYNSSLEAYRLGDLTINQIVNNDEEHIRKIYLTSYSFMDVNRLISGVDTLSTQLQEEYFLKNIGIDIVGRSYDKEILTKVSLEELSKLEFPTTYLDEICNEQVVYSYPMFELGSSVSDNSIAKEYQSDLEKRYNEEFVFIKENKNNFSYMFAPKNNIKLVFDVDQDKGSKYPALKVQQMVSKQLEKILENNNAKDRIVFYTSPAEEYEDIKKWELDKLSFDFNKPFDEINFVRDFVPRGVQTTFYYLYDKQNEEIDYEMICNIIKDANELYPSKTEMAIFDSKVFFVDISKKNREIAVELFRREENIVSTYPEIVMGMSFSRPFILRTDNEGFSFMDVYGDILDKHISYDGTEEQMLTVEEFIRKYTYENKY